MQAPTIKDWPMQLIYKDNELGEITYESSFGSGLIKVIVNWHSDVSTADSTIELFGVRIRSNFNCSSMQEAANKAEKFLHEIGNTIKNCGFMD